MAIAARGCGGSAEVARVKQRIERVLGLPQGWGGSWSPAGRTTERRMGG